MKSEFATHAALAALLVTGSLFLGACNHKYDNPPPGGNGSSGAVSTVITDAPSDEIESFAVDVTALTLTKVGGTAVSVLAAPVRVDLADLSDSSRLLTNSSVPGGTYTRATITLNLTTASAQIAGQSTSAAIVDIDGTPVTGSLTLPIQFPTSLSVAANAHQLLEMDLDLNQSFVVDSAANTLTFEPALVLHVDPTAPKDIIVAGMLLSTQTSSSTFHIQTHASSGASLDDVTCQAVSSTVYQVNGVPFTGSAGLTALAALGTGASVEAHGAIDATSAHIDVDFVEAGTGTFNGGSDIIEGFVTGRLGSAGMDATLTVLGRSQNAAHTVFQFDQSFTVTAHFLTTKVVMSGSSTADDLDAVNIGQKVRVFGALTGTAMDATTTQSVIRLQPTDVFGTANSPVSGTTLTLTVARVGFRPQSAFTWSDGGLLPPNPSAFVAVVGTLGSGLGITAGTPVVARGFMHGVADAGADMDATALTNSSTAPSLLFVRNRPLVGFTVTVDVTGATMSLTFTGSAAPGEAASIDVGFLGPVALPSSPVPNITGAGTSGVYTIHDLSTGTLTLFTDFQSYANAIHSALGTGGVLVQIGAVGTWTSSTSNLAATTSTAVVN